MASVKPPCIICQTPSVTRCSRCKIVNYCSEACQRKDWPTHKLACTPSTPTKATLSTSNTKQPNLPDPSKPLNVTEAAPPKGSMRKPAPQSSSTSLKFKYIPSTDNNDENLVIFFHGLGDKIEPNFTKLARTLQLPQTAAVCIQAPTPIPYLEEEGYQWYPSFNNLTGDTLGPEAPERIMQVQKLIRPELVKFIRHCMDYCGFNPRQILLFGFSQGAEIALDLAIFGGINFRAVISIAGYLMDESINATAVTKPLTTKVMILQGDKDNNRSVKHAKEYIKPIQRIFGKDNVTQCIVAGMGHGMPQSEEGWRPLMEFFANNLEHRTALETMADVYEIRG
ncbi:hypothetical protein FBU30_005189 [Linnemannia zychae]|nr:hypothetical protein FBU30_005189 [Linnemannia zychae]